jgi:hypothetical protein
MAQPPLTCRQAAFGTVSSVAVSGSASAANELGVVVRVDAREAVSGLASQCVARS